MVLATSHAVSLASLTADTEYTYLARSVDGAGNAAVSATATFHTAAGGTEPPLPPPDTGALISSLSVSTGRPVQVGVMTEGALKFTDRTYVFSGVPGLYVGQPYILTPNDDKSEVSAGYLTFTLGAPATVSVLFDDRVTALPAWLDGTWTQTADRFSYRIVLTKTFPAGSVTLGGNAMAPMAGAQSNYNVIVVPSADSTPDPEPTPNQPPA